ncbi:MAG TPA: hypothetical protein ENJ82_15720, partial [Bacteroidetes bacterium]|nr:hypothetical protein [Bacteroidota bacterium]
MAQYKAFCQNPDCEIEYLASRKDTKYCCKNCRNANYRIRQREAKEIESKQREWAERLQTELARLQAENERQQMILSEHAKIKLEGLPVLKSIREEREHLRLQIIVWERVLSLSVLETYNKYFNERVREAIRYWKGSPEERNALIQYFKGAPFDQILELQKETHLYPGERRYNMVEMFREAKQRELEEFTSLILELDMEKQKRSRVLLNSPKIVEAAKSAINSNNEKIGQLKSKLANPPEIQKPTLKPQKAKPLLRFDQKKKKGGKVNVRDLRGMEFNTFTLDGELGRFLGNIERNMMAVALTGNPGAGKSQFTFFMARVLLDAGLSVMYFSLEEGIGQTTIEKLDRAMIEEGGAMDFEAQGKLHDV